MALKYVTVIGLSLLTQGALACATCSGPADAPQTLGMNAAILTLFGVMCVVGLTIASFIGLIALRVKRQNKAEALEQDRGSGPLAPSSDVLPGSPVMLET